MCVCAQLQARLSGALHCGHWWGTEAAGLEGSAKGRASISTMILRFPSLYSGCVQVCVCVCVCLCLHMAGEAEEGESLCVDVVFCKAAKTWVCL